jgi:hypothetical protein
MRIEVGPSSRREMVSLGGGTHSIDGGGPSPRVRQIASSMPTTMNMRITNQSLFVADSERKKCLTTAVMGGLHIPIVGADIGFDRRTRHQRNAATLRRAS